MLFLPTRERVRVKIVEGVRTSTQPGNHAIMMYQAFTEFLEEEIGELPNIKPVIVARPGLMVWEYVAMTTALIEYLAGEIDEKLLEAAQVIDRRLGLGEEIVGMRLFPAIGGPYVWREGEGAIDLGYRVSVIVRPARTYPMRYVSPGNFDSAITHIAGYVTIEAAKALAGEGGLEHLARIHRGLWHALYGVPVSDGNIIIVRDMGRAVALEFRLGART